MRVGNKEFKNYTYVMAIINLTPDSFYTESRVKEDGILFAAEKAVKEGAAILDLGAQSTRPGYKEVPFEEELSRLEKPLYLIKKNFDIPVSVDTYFPEVASAAFLSGADMLNDIRGLTSDGMAEVVAKHKKSVCIMHNAKERLSDDIFPQILSFLKNQAQLAEKAGVDREAICLDGGVGFAKSVEQNKYLIENYSRLATLGYPLLLGASRKSVFGGDVKDRLAPTLESTRFAAKNKILFVRVHDVKENVRAIREEYERD